MISYPSANNNADGRLEVFLVGQNNQLYHRYQTAPNNDWNSEWLSLGGKWDKNKIPALANNADGRLEVFLVGQNNQLYHRYQTAPNNDWNSEWLSLGGKW
jgi:hypothetical protein